MEGTERPIIPLPRPPDALIPHSYDFQTTHKEAQHSSAGPNSQNQLRHYDFGIRQFIQGVLVFDGQLIPCIDSSPMRAFSSYRQLLNDGKVAPIIFPEDGQLEPDKFPLPFSSFERTDWKPRRAEQNPSGVIRNLGFVRGGGERRTAYSRYPVPVDLPYQIDVWVRWKNHLNYLQQRLYMQFEGAHAHWFVRTPYRCDNDFLMAIRFEGLKNLSDLEVDKDRILRLTLNVVVEGWLFDDIMIAPTMLRDDVSYNLPSAP